MQFLPDSLIQKQTCEIYKSLHIKEKIEYKLFPSLYATIKQIMARCKSLFKILSKPQAFDMAQIPDIVYPTFEKFMPFDGW